jgi:peptidylprolyl isomerase
MADIGFTHGSKDGVANGMHENVRVGVPLQALVMRNFYSAQDQFAPRHQRMNVVANANMDHGRTIELRFHRTKEFRPALFASAEASVFDRLTFAMTLPASHHMNERFRLALRLLLFLLVPSLLFAADESKKKAGNHPPGPTMAEVLAASQPTDWRPLALESTLYLELPAGRVVIELAPGFAPHHVDNVKALAREHYFDGLAIVRCQDNYVVQWADPNAEKPELKKPIQHARATLNAEFDRELAPKLPFTQLPDGDVYAPEVGFSGGFPVARDPKAKKMWLVHCYGMVGAGRDTKPDSGGGTELYVVIGQAPRHLDRNVTLLGRVVQGMELLSALPRGTGALGFYEKPEQRVPIKAVRLAADVPEAERSNVEVMRTDTPRFQELIESRRNRREEWFGLPAGHIEICNVPIPVRSAPAQRGH